LVHLQQGLLERQARLLGTTACDDLGGLDRTQFDGRGRTGRIASDQGLTQAGETLGDFFASLGANLGAGQAVSEYRGLSLERLLESAQAELSGLDLAIGDGPAEAQPLRPFESLAQRSRPDLTFIQKSPTRITQTLTADLKGQHRIPVG
jgi:hypothetical protein